MEIEDRRGHRSDLLVRGHAGACVRAREPGGVSWKERHSRSDSTLSEESTERGGILDRRNCACKGLEG